MRDDQCPPTRGLTPQRGESWIMPLGKKCTALPFALRRKEEIR